MKKTRIFLVIVLTLAWLTLVCTNSFAERCDDTGLPDSGWFGESGC